LGPSEAESREGGSESHVRSVLWFVPVVDDGEHGTSEVGSNEVDLMSMITSVIVKAKTLFTFNVFLILHDNAILRVDLQE
jgi:hypothetical protein